MNTRPTHCIEVDEVINSSAARVFAIYCRVAQWPEWDPETRAAHVETPLRVGARGWLKPAKGLKVKMTVVALEPDRRLNFVCPVLGSKMYFEHDIHALTANQVRVTHRLRFEGWLAGWLYRKVGVPAGEKLPHTLALLKALAEKR